MSLKRPYIILNWMLPAIPSFPSPAMSVLKAQLTQMGYEVRVVYWNFLLLPVVEAYWGRKIGDFDDHLEYYLSPLFSYIALDMGDEEAIARQYNQWKKAVKGRMGDEQMFRGHIVTIADQINEVVHSAVMKYHYGECLFTGFYQKLFQMYGADVVARRLKVHVPQLRAVLGGIDTKDEALACMDNFPVYDYALYGEGESTLLRLAQMLKGKMEKKDVGNLVWREADKFRISKPNRTFVKLDESVIPDYSDYFEQAVVKREKIRLPIEGSRGCHWARCRFCFHNEGTRYRRKSPSRIGQEIRMQMEKYGIHQISFLDNDTIGKDVEQFKLLLQELAAIKRDYPDFHITRAEVVTRSLNANLVRQMAAVGFRDVQIGYESLSDNLLEAIHKCNSFSSNFLYIKWALLSGIKIRGANLIMNLLEEDKKCLSESLDTLRFLRFILADMKFMHVYSTLWIKHSSRYFKEIERSGRLDDWKVFKSFQSLPANYLKEQNKYVLQFFVKPTFHPMWDAIEETEWKYIREHRTYSIDDCDGRLFYREYVNGELIAEEHLSDLDWALLILANERLVQREELSENPSFTAADAEESLKRLKALGIIYYYKDYRNIITIINTDCERNKQQRYT